MDYNYIQFIAYQVNTFPKVNDVAYAMKEYTLASGTKVMLPTWEIEKVYLGGSKEEADVKARCELMKEAITKASRRSEISASNKCLKLFMAPEFYFRGSKGAYSLEAYQSTVEKLRAMVQGAQWEHWLFVFGSILAVFDPTSAETEGSRGSMAGKRAVLNVVLVQKGNRGEAGSAVIIKETMSPIDFSNYQLEEVGLASSGTGVLQTVGTAQTAGNIWDEQVDHLRAGKPGGAGWDPNRGAGKENQTVNYSGLGIFEVGGITFGLEVCLDHALARLKLSPPSKNWIQVQLIPSAGMTIQPDSVIACKGGYAFNCDGNERCDLQQVEKDWKDSSGCQLKVLAAPFAVSLHAASPSFARCFQKEASLQIYRSLPLPQPKKV